jgi:hypothetical protein
MYPASRTIICMVIENIFNVRVFLPAKTKRDSILKTLWQNKHKSIDCVQKTNKTDCDMPSSECLKSNIRSTVSLKNISLTQCSEGCGSANKHV